MTSALDLGTMEPEPFEGPIPNHHASGTSGDSGEGKERKKRPGIFGSGKSNVPGRSPTMRVKRESPPKLTAGARQNLENFYTMVGATVRTFDPMTGDMIIEQAPACAKSVYNLAQENDAVRRAVLAFSTISTSGAVIMAHLPILLVIMGLHGPEKLRPAAVGSMVAIKMMSAQEAEENFPAPETAETE